MVGELKRKQVSDKKVRDDTIINRFNNKNPIVEEKSQKGLKATKASKSEDSNHEVVKKFKSNKTTVALKKSKSDSMEVEAPSGESKTNFTKPGNKSRKEAEEEGMGASGELKKRTKRVSSDPKAARTAVKDARKERRSKRPNFTFVEAANALLKLSFARMDPEERLKHISKMLKETEGKLDQIAMVNDASRSIQICCKYGSNEHRDIVFKGFTTNFLSLCQNHYGFHAVEKLLKYGDIKMRDKVLEELTGHFKHISQHRDGHHVLEFLYSNEGMISNDQKRKILVEFYGPQFKLLLNKDGNPHTLTTIFENENESKQDVAMKNIRAHIDKMVAKGLTRVGILHTLLRQYIQFSHLSTIQEISNVCQAFLEDLWLTQDGCRVIMYCIAVSSAKDRKVFIKSLSDNLKTVIEFPFGCDLVKFVLQVVDDTVLLRKQIVVPIVELITELLLNPHGIKLILHLLAPESKRYFNALELSAISIPSLHYPAEQESFIVSKKDLNVRRQELLGDRVLPLIVQTFVEDDEKLNEYIRDATLSSILIEALRHSKDSDYGLQGIEKVAKLVLGEDENNVLSHPVAHRAIQRMLLFDNPAADEMRQKRLESTNKENPSLVITESSTPSSLAIALHSHLTGHYSKWISTCGAFVIKAIMENSTLKIASSINSELKKHMKALEKDGRPGATLLLKVLKANSKL